MKNNLLLHPSTLKNIFDSSKSKAQTYIISGRKGEGKLSVAYLLIAMKMNMTIKEVKKIVYLLHIIPNENSISIENIRDIQKFFKLKTLGSHEYKRVLIIQDSHCMSLEAQNAFLKLMEEPPSDTLIILTLVPSDKVLSTIISRALLVNIIKPTLSSAVNYFIKDGIAENDIKTNYLISNGCIGLLVAILKNDTSNPLIHTIENAKKIYASSKVVRLAQINTYKERNEMTDLLYAMKRIAVAALESSAKTNSIKNLSRWIAVTEKCENAEIALHSNPNTKLLLTDLFLSL
ncbi:MAG: hypothetical protein NVSMB46_09880 [Candidatus Saccharimonadales bacterium]